MSSGTKRATQATPGLFRLSELNLLDAAHEAQADPASRKVELRPNPTTGWLSVRLTGFETGACRIEVHDQMGRAVQQRNVDIRGSEQSILLDLQGTARGFYWVNITSVQGSVVRKIVVG